MDSTLLAETESKNKKLEGVTCSTNHLIKRNNFNSRKSKINLVQTNSAQHLVLLLICQRQTNLELLF